jgi:hypothetical protein
MKSIILLPTSNTMHQERIVFIEFLEDGKHAKLETEVLFPCSCKGDRRSYPAYPIDILCLRIT